MTNEEYSNLIRQKIIEACEAVLQKKSGIIAASRKLISLSAELLDKPDKDFLTIVLIDSETDHLPVDSERENWRLEALERKDKEIAEYESFYKEAAFRACRKLIRRFGDSVQKANIVASDYF